MTRIAEQESLLSTLDSNGEDDVDRRESDDTNDGALNFDQALNRAGFGPFQYWLLFVCGWANASDAIEVLCISFVLPTAECELKLTSSDKGWLSATVFLGLLVGGYLWGSLGDNIGRRSVLISCLLMNSICGFASSFLPEKRSFIFVRFLCGVGVGGSIPVVWSYFGEFLPAAVRGKFLSLLATFWMVGNMSVAALAWVIIPQDLRFFASWRLFVFVCGLPSFLVCLALMKLPESPKYLLSKGKERECVKVLSEIFNINSGKPVGDFPQVERLTSNATDPGGFTSSMTFYQSLTNAKFLFTGSLARNTLLLMTITFSIQFGYYGLFMWFPEIFNKLENYYLNHTDSKTVCEISNMQNLKSDILENCVRGSSTIETSVFVNSFIVSLAALPGNLWTIFYMDSLGRKFFLVFSLLSSGICAFLIYLVNGTGANLAVSSVFGAVSVMGFNALNCFGIELFPTVLRSLALAVILVPARLGAIVGNVVFGYLIDTSCAIPILLSSSFLFLGGFLGLLLPETTRRNLT